MMKIIQELGKGAYFIVEEFEKPLAISTCTPAALIFSNRLAKEHAHPRFYGECEKARGLHASGIQVSDEGITDADFDIPKNVMGLRLAVRGLLSNLARKTLSSNKFQ